MPTSSSTDNNPPDDIDNTIHSMMKNGELFEGHTLNQVWPEQKELEPLWFCNNYYTPMTGDALSYGKTTTPCTRGLAGIQRRQESLGWIYYSMERSCFG